MKGIRWWLITWKKIFHQKQQMFLAHDNPPWNIDAPLKDFSRRSCRRAAIVPNSKLAGVISCPANWGLNSSIPWIEREREKINSLCLSQIKIISTLVVCFLVFARPAVKQGRFLFPPTSMLVSNAQMKFYLVDRISSHK